MFLLDTNVISELRIPTRCDLKVRKWALSNNPDRFFLSVVSIFEIELGARRIARRDVDQARVFDTWLTGILHQFDRRVLSYDAMAARRCAALHVPDPRPERDAMIGATALVHGFTVVTRNVADFAPMGVRLLNPWADPAPASR